MRQAIQKVVIKIQAEFASTLSSDEAVEQDNIPCLLWIGEDDFQLRVFKPLFDVTAYALSWEQSKINLVAPAYAGTNFTHSNFAMDTLSKIDRNRFGLMALPIFYPETGWEVVFENRDKAKTVNEVRQ